MDTLRTHNPLRHLLFAGLMALVALGTVGCGSDDDNPTNPGGVEEPPPGEEEILTPTNIRIRSVRLDRFNETKESGGAWDLSTSVSNRRPDVYVTLRSGTLSADPFFVSKVQENAFSNTFISLNDGRDGTRLPAIALSGTIIWIRVMDDDGLSADDQIGGTTLVPLSRYNDDNASTFYWYVEGTGGTRVTITGDWIY